jgi:hypothetical protein
VKATRGWLHAKRDVSGAASILAAVTVHRVASPAPPDAAQYRTDLGRVLVTIDDLAALMAFLTRPDEGSAAVAVEFHGGYFTEAEELRSLSDVETKILTLRTPKVQVALNPWAAVAAGDRQEAEAVYREWARSRQTRLKPSPLQLFDMMGYIVVLLIGLIVVLTFTVLAPLLRHSSPTAFELIMGGVTLVPVIFLGIVIRRQDRASKPSSYAVVIPMSLHEYRQNRSNQMYPRRSWILAIISAIVAALSVAAVVWIKVTSK